MRKVIAVLVLALVVLGGSVQAAGDVQATTTTLWVSGTTFPTASTDVESTTSYSTNYYVMGEAVVAHVAVALGSATNVKLYALGQWPGGTTYGRVNTALDTIATTGSYNIRIPRESFGAYGTWKLAAQCTGTTTGCTIAGDFSREN